MALKPHKYHRKLNELLYNQEAQIPGTQKDVKEIMGDRLVVASAGGSPPKVEKKEISKGIKL